MFRKLRFISLLLCFFLVFANVDVIYAKAAPLNKTEARQIANGIERASSSKYTQIVNGKVKFLSNFVVTDLEQPKHGKLLDSKATVVSDNGLKWEIPVLWVNQDGELIKIAIEIKDITQCLPVFVFYLPEGYSLMFGKNTSFNISMPDFVCERININGVATLSDPNRGITYITPKLQGQDKVVAKTTPDYYASSDDQDADSGSVAPIVTEDEDNNGGNGGGGSGKSSKAKYQYSKYNPKLDEEASKKLAAQNATETAVTELGAEKVAWLVSYIKDVIEPEAVNILLQKFPAYKAAAKDGELGKSIGYVVSYDGTDKVIAKVEDKTTDTDYLYKLNVNGYYFYKYDTYSGTTKTEAEYNDSSDEYLDRTLVHEMMHAMMDDYTRSGMTGKMYDEATGKIVDGTDNAFPNWFVEGMATSVGSPYQHWVYSFRKSYSYDSKEKSYSSDAIKAAYTSDSTLQLSYGEAGTGDDRASSYMNGWLANVYLGALASQAYDNKSAVKEKSDGTATFNSQYVLNGLNHILEELHKGKSLDDVIKEISTTGTGTDAKTLYTSASDFASKFIASSGDAAGDDGASLAFCTKFLNYLETASNDETKTYANGSVLVNFTDTSTLLLNSSLKKMPEVYALAETKELVESTVDEKTAYASGGKKEDGIKEASSAASSASSQTSGTDGSKVATVTGKEYFDAQAASSASSGSSASSASSASSGSSTSGRASVLAATRDIEAGEESDAASSDCAAAMTSEDYLEDEQDEEVTEEASAEGTIQSTSEASTPSEDSNADQESQPEAPAEPQPEPQPETSAADTAQEDAFVPDTVIISESEPEEDNSSDNNHEEQILDAITQPDNHDEEDSGPEETPTE